MVPCNEVRNMSGESPNIVDLLQSGLVDYVFSTSAKGRDPKRDSVRLRRKAVELSIPLHHCCGYRQCSGRLPAQRP